MKTLNLVYPENSDIKFKISKFPDQQQQVTILGYTQNLANDFFKEIKDDSVQIKARLNNWLDLELITCAVASLRELGVEEIHLYTPYIVGARSDRKFGNGENNYLKDVICPAINALNCKTVICVDPHSDCLEMGIKNFRKESNLELVKFTISDLYNKKGILDLAGGDGEDGEDSDYFWMQCRDCKEYMDVPKKSKKEHFCPDCNTNENNFVLISPDAGASKKIFKVAELIGYTGDIITCSKDRDENGKLTKCIVPIKNTPQIMNKDIIILDDICDGGNTFINIAKVLKEHPAVGKIYLIVTHGIFSAGFDELYKYFEAIYCTNSYSETRGEHSLPIFSKGNFVKQLNIF